MILSRKWLNEFVDCSAWADHDFSEAMTLSGSKVETFTDLHKNIQNVVAGRIVEMVRHTNSDHMWVCQVDVGGDAPLQIVTGAQNQKVGDMVPVALDGSLLPDGKEIHAGMLRGELDPQCDVGEVWTQVSQVKVKEEHVIIEHVVDGRIVDEQEEELPTGEVASPQVNEVLAPHEEPNRIEDGDDYEPVIETVVSSAQVGNDEFESAVTLDEEDHAPRLEEYVQEPVDNLSLIHISEPTRH